jgi:hypothetical protein
VINEAVAAGLAVVASDMVGAAADLVRDGVNGRIFLHGNLESLSECLRDATAAEQSKRFGANSIEVLAQWRKLADPVDGLKKALRSVGVIAPPSV